MSVKTDASRQITEGVIWKQLLIFSFRSCWGAFSATLQYSRYSGSRTVCGKRSAGSSGRFLSADRQSHCGIFTGLSSGASVIIAHFFGARDRRSASKAVHNAYVLAVAGGIVLTVLGVLLTPHMLSLMNTPEATMGGCSSLSSHLFWGSYFYFHI